MIVGRKAKQIKRAISSDVIGRPEAAHLERDAWTLETL